MLWSSSPHTSRVGFLPDIWELRQFFIITGERLFVWVNWPFTYIWTWDEHASERAAVLMLNSRESPLWLISSESTSSNMSVQRHVTVRTDGKNILTALREVFTLLHMSAVEWCSVMTFLSAPHYMLWGHWLNVKQSTPSCWLDSCSHAASSLISCLSWTDCGCTTQDTHFTN